MLLKQAFLYLKYYAHGLLLEQIFRKRLLEERSEQTRKKQESAINEQRLSIRKRLEQEKKLLHRQLVHRKVCKPCKIHSEPPKFEMLEAFDGDGHKLQMPLCRFMKQLYTDISRKWDVLHLSSAADGAQPRMQDNAC